MPEQLTKLQSVILRLEELGLPLRDAMRIATQEVGFFVGQQRYLQEREKALKIAAELRQEGQQEPAQSA